jgi:hypothetical protein
MAREEQITDKLNAIMLAHMQLPSSWGGFGLCSAAGLHISGGHVGTTRWACRQHQVAAGSKTTVDVTMGCSGVICIPLRLRNIRLRSSTGTDGRSGMNTVCVSCQQVRHMEMFPLTLNLWELGGAKRRACTNRHVQTTGDVAVTLLLLFRCCEISAVLFLSAGMRMYFKSGLLVYIDYAQMYLA